MGYICHHAILVTCWDETRLRTAREKSVEIFQPKTVSLIIEGVVNGYCTFLIGPDGSKEGWDDSDAGDSRRDKFIAWLDEQRYEDGSTPYDWAHVQYGDGDGDNKILADENTNAPSEEEASVRFADNEPGLGAQRAADREEMDELLPLKLIKRHEAAFQKFIFELRTAGDVKGAVKDLDATRAALRDAIVGSQRAADREAGG